MPRKNKRRKTESKRVPKHLARHIWLCTIRKEKVRQQGGKCFYCPKRIGKLTATIDHVRPLSDGGRDHENNMVACCRDCNNSKGSRNVTQWLLDRKHHEQQTADIQTEHGATGCPENGLQPA
ncbi:MAG: HNH endonuclease [Bdellovibrionales bacterium]